jgi:hypothetical protein
LSPITATAPAQTETYCPCAQQAEKFEHQYQLLPQKYNIDFIELMATLSGSFIATVLRKLIVVYKATLNVYWIKITNSS